MILIKGILRRIMPFLWRWLSAYLFVSLMVWFLQSERGLDININAAATSFFLAISFIVSEQIR